MKQPLYYNQQQPNRIIISLALVQSELFWLCSAFFCIFQESGLLLKKPSTKASIKHKRTRSHSEPLQRQPLPKETMKTKKDRDDKAHRRFSLPPTTESSEIRKRPTPQDELTGTTCPPIWWQKTRVMLGHAPVHGDPKPKSINNNKAPTTAAVPSSSSTKSLTQIETNNTSSAASSSSSSSSSVATTTTTDNNNNKSIYSLSPVASVDSTLSNQSGGSSISSSTNQKRNSATKKLVSKLNSAFRLRKS